MADLKETLTKLRDKYQADADARVAEAERLMATDQERAKASLAEAERLRDAAGKYDTASLLVEMAAVSQEMAKLQAQIEKINQVLNQLDDAKRAMAMAAAMLDLSLALMSQSNPVQTVSGCVDKILKLAQA
jgi:DNA repair exonuclease SbcCD ATPase subunit